MSLSIVKIIQKGGAAENGESMEKQDLSISRRRIFMKVFRLLAICMMAAVVSAPLFGQGASSTYGNIYGKVTDESGGALPGVSVTLSGNGGARTTTSGGQGDFRFLNLAPGSYTVKSELSGFSTVERTNVTVSLGANTEVSIPMKIASVATTITVSSETPLL